MNFDKRLLSQAWLMKGTLILTVVLGLTVAVLIVIQARLLSTIIQESYTQRKELQQITHWLIILLVVIVFRSIVHYGSEVSAGMLAIRVKKNLRGMLLEKILKLGPSFTQGEESGELIAVVIRGIEALDAYFSQYIPQVILAAFIPIVILIMVFPLDFISGIILLLTIPLLPVFLYLVGVAFEKLTSKQWLALRRMSAYFLDTLQGLTTLKSLNQSRAQIGQIARISDEYRHTTLKVLRATFLSALVLELTSTISTAIVAVQIGLRLLAGKLGFEHAFFILVITPEFYLPLRLLGMRFHAGMSGVSSAQSIFTILETQQTEELSVNSLNERIPYKSSLDGGQRKDLSQGNSKITPLNSIFQNGYINFDQVSYTYPDRGEGALREASFKIKFGNFTAFVGKSGAGKTTIASLLLRFIAPKSGRITIGDLPLENLPPDEWRKYIAYVPQIPYLFNDTVTANIKVADFEADMDEVQLAAKKANLDSDIRQLPQGYDTKIGESGVMLSAGQRQRLALARAFLRHSPIILMDEPSEHLDPQQEELFRQTLNSLFQGRTVILIAHYIPSILLADKIIVLHKGRIVESGTHDDLLKSRGEYHQLVSHWLDAQYGNI